jgi:hypothetical protein
MPNRLLHLIVIAIVSLPPNVGICTYDVFPRAVSFTTHCDLRLLRAHLLDDFTPSSHSIAIRLQHTIAALTIALLIARDTVNAVTVNPKVFCPTVCQGISKIICIDLAAPTGKRGLRAFPSTI